MMFTSRGGAHWLPLLVPICVSLAACGGTSSDSSGDPARGGGGSGEAGTLGTGASSGKGGYVRRPSATTCTVSGGADGGQVGAGEAADAPGALGSTCNVDADCSAIVLGYCTRHQTGFEAGLCAAGCLQDSDCGSHAVCVCDGSAHGGTCVAASCKTDADCGSGSGCAEVGTPQCGVTSFACERDEDECTSNADCSSDGVCIIQDSHRLCHTGCSSSFD